jgi:hypothetical protein
MMKTARAPSHQTTAIATAFGILIGVVVAVLTSDVILGVIAGASFIAITAGLWRLWTGGGDPRARHP